VVLDSGHDGGNADNPEIINQLVDAGHGVTKTCDTAGTTTQDGYPEHAFNFDVALRIRAILAARGVTVLLTRPDDTGVGPCITARAAFGNAHHAAAYIAIHADGADPSGSGFHVIEEASMPLGGPAQAAASDRLAQAVRARMLAESGFGYSTYIGNGQALDRRDDLGGLNLSTQPSVFVECGNMRNSTDAARQESPAGRQRVAQALAGALLDFLAASR